MILDTLKTDALAARKRAVLKDEGGTAAGKTARLLTTVISTVDQRAKDELRDPTDTDTQAVIKAFLKGIDQSLQAAPADRKADLQAEETTLKGYLPATLEGDELTAAIKAAANVSGASVEMKSTKTIMEVLNKTYPGRVDGKLVSEAIKSWPKS